MREESRLTHHEELRLDYLYKNIHYLNNREKQELAYLQAKDAGLEVVPSSRRTMRTGNRERARRGREDWPDELPPYPRESRRKERSRKQAIERNGYADTDELLVDELPRYPRNQSPSLPRKKRLKRRKSLFKSLLKLTLLLLLVTLVGMVAMFFKGLSGGKELAGDNVRQEVFHGESSPNGVNILILGTDGRVGDSSEMTRTDSIMVLNVNNKDKKIKLVSFMRDTLVSIEGYDYKLNVAYTFGEQNDHQGAENVRQVLKENFDISIQHYALVDFASFATAIDTLFPNGVQMDAQFSTVEGQEVSQVEVPDDLNITAEGVPMQVIQVGPQRMDGRTLLNYARFRKDDEGDYGRTRRQQEVMAAILTQIKDPTKLFTGAEAAGKIFSMTSTSLPHSFIVTNGFGAAWDSQNGIEHTTIPELGDWIDEYDIYGGAGLKIDFEKYKQRLSELGFR